MGEWDKHTSELQNNVQTHTRNDSCVPVSSEQTNIGNWRAFYGNWWNPIHSILLYLLLTLDSHIVFVYLSIYLSVTTTLLNHSQNISFVRIYILNKNLLIHVFHILFPNHICSMFFLLLLLFFGSWFPIECCSFIVDENHSFIHSVPIVLLVCKWPAMVTYLVGTLNEKIWAMLVSCEKARQPLVSNSRLHCHKWMKQDDPTFLLCCHMCLLTKMGTS